MKIQSNIDFAFKYPPEVKLCLIHRKANRMFRNLPFIQQGQLYQKCQCCGRFVAQNSDAPLISYQIEQQLQIYGSGIPLLFIFMQNNICVVFMLMLVVGIYSLVTNIANNSCQSIISKCTSDSLNNISISNKLLDASSVAVQAYLILTLTVLWIIVHQIGLVRCKNTEIQVDKQTQTPSDFAIIIKDLPDNASQLAIRRMVKKRSDYLNFFYRDMTDSLEIQNIILPKNSREYLKKVKKQEEDFKSKIEQNKESQFKWCRIPKIQQKADRIAIVVFKKSMSKEFFIKNNSLGQQRFILSCCPQDNKYSICNKQVRIQRAPQPDDIIWQNLDQDEKDIFYRKIIFILIGLGFLTLGGYIQYELALWQMLTQGFQKKLVSIFSSAVIVITNFVIRYFLIWSTNLQKNITFSKQSRSLNLKLCYLQFLNAGVFYAFANVLTVSFSQFKITDNFALNITTFMIINAIEPTLTTFFMDYFQFPNFILRFLMEKKYKKYTQKQANQIYEYPKCSVHEKYSYVIKTLLLTCFYTPFVPIVSFISLGGLILYYITVKFLFRVSYKLPRTHTNEINIGSNRLSAMAPFALNAGQMFIYGYIVYKLKEPADTTGSIILFISFAISCVCLFMPWHIINQKLFSPRFNRQYRVYNQHLDNFEITYEKAYPLYECLKQTRVNNRDNYFLQKYLRQSSKDRRNNSLQHNIGKVVDSQRVLKKRNTQ